MMITRRFVGRLGATLLSKWGRTYDIGNEECREIVVQAKAEIEQWLAYQFADAVTIHEDHVDVAQVEARKGRERGRGRGRGRAREPVAEPVDNETAVGADDDLALAELESDFITPVVERPRDDMTTPHTPLRQGMDAREMQPTCCTLTPPPIPTFDEDGHAPSQINMIDETNHLLPFHFHDTMITYQCRRRC